MAEVQLFEPEFNEIFTDRGWRAAFAGRTGIACDADGSAFGLTLPAEGSTVELGSPSQPSRLVVDGFGLEVPAATTQSLVVPASVGGGTNGRTDLIVGRLTTGPVNLQLDRVPGTEGSTAVPSASYDPVGTRDLVLYRIRRREDEGLNQAIVTDMRPRIGLSYLVPPGALLPSGVSLSDRATRDGVTYRRDMVGSSAQWVAEAWPFEVLTGTSATAAAVSGWQRSSSCEMVRHGADRRLRLVVTRGPGQSTIESDDRGAFGSIAGQSATIGLATLHDQDKPPAGTLIPMIGRVLTIAGNPFTATGVVSSTGSITIIATAPNITIAWSSSQEKGAEILLEARWRV